MADIIVNPEFGIEIPENVPYMDLKARAEAACATINKLERAGLEVQVTEEDRDVASTLLTAYAKDPAKTSKTVTDTRTSRLSTGALVETHEILDEYGRVIVGHAVQIRNMVVNRLILESDSPDPRIRIKALELLGKMSDVDLFTNKQEVTVTHKAPDMLREKLREKLEDLKNSVEIEDAEYVVEGRAADDA